MVLWTTELAAVDVYVATNGRDDRTGTINAPYRTLKQALAKVGPGDTVFLRGGSYGERIDTNWQRVPAGNSWSSPVTVRAYPGESVRLGRVNIQGSSYRYIIFQDLIFDNRGEGNHNTIRLAEGANHIRLLNVEVTGAGHSGISVVGGRTVGHADYNEFINVNSHNNGLSPICAPNYCHAIYIGGASDNLIQGGTYHSSFAGYGIHIYTSSGGNNRNIVQGVQAYGNTGYGVIMTGGNSNRLSGSDVFWNGRGGVEVQWGSGSNSSVIQNNRIYSNGGYAVMIGGNAWNTQVYNNVLGQNSRGALYDRGIGTVAVGNLVSVICGVITVLCND
jgi:hypothetical protein